MANPHKGEVVLQREGGPLTLRFDVNALAELEDLLDASCAVIISRMASDMRLNLLKALVWAACREHHPEVTLKEAGRIIQDVSVPAAEAAVTEAVRRAFPDPTEDGQATGDPPTPPPADGNGPTSISSGANSD